MKSNNNYLSQVFHKILHYDLRNTLLKRKPEVNEQEIQNEKINKL